MVMPAPIVMIPATVVVIPAPIVGIPPIVIIPSPTVVAIPNPPVGIAIPECTRNLARELCSFGIREGALLLRDLSDESLRVAPVTQRAS